MKHIAKLLLLSAAFIAMGFAPLRADHRNDYGRNDYGRDDYGRKAPRTVRLRDHDTRVVRSRRAPARHYRNSHKVRKHRRHYLTTRTRTRYHAITITATFTTTTTMDTNTARSPRRLLLRRPWTPIRPWASRGQPWLRASPRTRWRPLPAQRSCLHRHRSPLLGAGLSRVWEVLLPPAPKFGSPVHRGISSCLTQRTMRFPAGD